ncbi:hypothetical protein MKX01_040995 [Papaver californicum]|nr:hypothetical protein MKX01_040995 [Papaver californicum]
MGFLVFYSLIILSWVLDEAAVVASIIGTEGVASCQHNCGNVSIPYPFGVGTADGCSIDGYDFLITCYDTFEPPRPFFGDLHVTNILVVDGQMTVMLYMAFDCFNDNIIDKYSWAKLRKFTFSDTRNKFVAIGCDTKASIKGKISGSYTTGCFSVCDSIDDVVNGSCVGIGCCQTAIPKGLQVYDVRVTSINEQRRNLDFNPCSYAFLTEESSFNFTSTSLQKFNEQTVPVVLEWTVGDQTCDEAKKNSTSYECGPNTNCYEPGSAPGYRCICMDGYEGNPYLTSGHGSCQDVDECDKSLRSNICNGLENICENKNGSYKCSCPLGYSQSRNTGSIFDCYAPTPKTKSSNKIFIGAGIGIMLILVSVVLLYFGVKKRKLMKLKEKFFEQNGGYLLTQLLESDQNSKRNYTRIFTMEELKKATNNYDERQILGQGGSGTVYKGTLTDGKLVAIKRSKIVDRTQIQQFVNEVVVLSQINHRNVVQLLGSCLETEVPLLVYEFVANGTLFHHLHKHDDDGHRLGSLSWKERLRIALEVASSLAYLHSAASIPIIHRDIKSSNILLDHNYTAKVADFGASTFIPIDKTELTTMVQGTLGYLDPEYFHTSQLTDKSDVYSFGVLLAELLTGRMALEFHRPENERNLANYFLSSLKLDYLFNIQDEIFASHKEAWSLNEQLQLQQVAELTRRCLRVKGEKRPTMNEVVMILDGLRMSSRNSWICGAELDS